MMSVKLSATFDTRREAEMTVERLVQQFKLDRSAVSVTAEGDENSVGEDQAGSDTKAAEPSVETRDDAPLNGAILVSVDVVDDGIARQVRDAFAEFDAADVVEADRA
jgi:hypothetical protein